MQLPDKKAPVSRDFVYSLLQQCIKSKDLSLAKRAHCLMIHSRIHRVASLSDLLIRFYGSCGCLLDANLAFNTVSYPNVYTWHAIISTHSSLGENQRALELYTKMLAEGFEPDRVLLLCILRTCREIGAFEEGCLVYKQVFMNGFETHATIQSAVIHMYAKCGSIDDARKVFDSFGKQDTVLWSTMMTAYMCHGDSAAAIELYRQMHFERIQPDKVTFLCILKAVYSDGDLVNIGKIIHHEINVWQNEIDAVLGSAIIQVYVKCGCMEDAHSMFEKMGRRNTVTWNAVIAGYTDHGHGYTALELYRRMQQQDGLKPEKVTFLCILKACSIIAGGRQGRLVHDQLIRDCFESDNELKNSLIDMYAKCGILDEALKVFKSVDDIKDVIAWNSVIGGSTQQEQFEFALNLFQAMQKEGVLPDRVTCVHALKACASLKKIDHGRLLHDEIIEIGLAFDLVVGSTLVDMYCKCKSFEDGQKVFECIQGRNLVCWNAIISGYVHNGQDYSALELFEQMEFEAVEPNHVTLSCILKACGNLGDGFNSKVIHDRIIRSEFKVDKVLVCTLVDVYAKCGCLNESHWAFDRLNNRNVATWAALISGYANHGHGMLALRMFQEMQEEGLKPDKVTYLCVLKAVSSFTAAADGKLIHDQILRDNLDSNLVIGNTLVDMYAKWNKLDEALKVFYELPLRDVVSWGAMITGYVECGDSATALQLYEKMEIEGHDPECSTYLSILRACGSIVALEEGSIVHEKIIRRYLDSDPAVANTLVDMYAKCGRMRDASKLFQQLTFRDVISWNAMIAGYAMESNYQSVRHFLVDMHENGLNPDDRTFTSILSSCSHAGAVDECLEFFGNMIRDHDIKPGIEHFNCVVDCFARAGCLKSAKEVLQSMPDFPDSSGLVSVLSSCSIHGDLKIGTQCFNEIDSEFASDNTLFSTLYANSEESTGKQQDFVSRWEGKEMSSIDVEKMHHTVVENESFEENSCGCITPNRLDCNFQVPKVDLVLCEEMKKEDIWLGLLTSVEGVNMRYARSIGKINDQLLDTSVYKLLMRKVLYLKLKNICFQLQFFLSLKVRNLIICSNFKYCDIICKHIDNSLIKFYLSCLITRFKQQTRRCDNLSNIYVKRYLAIFFPKIFFVSIKYA